MSYPKKTKGWRNLTFHNQRFRWCFVVKSENSVLKLQGSSSASQQVIVTLREWNDPWLAIGKTDNLPNKPRVITAKFVCEAVAFALQNDWQPNKTGEVLRFEYENNSCQFSCVS